MVRQKVQCDNLFMIGPETHDIENRKWRKRKTKIKKHEEGKGEEGGVYIQLWFTQWKSTLSTHRV